jgi:hypothetical protein
MGFCISFVGIWERDKHLGQPIIIIHLCFLWLFLSPSFFFLFSFFLSHLYKGHIPLHQQTFFSRVPCSNQPCISLACVCQPGQPATHTQANRTGSETIFSSCTGFCPMPAYCYLPTTYLTSYTHICTLTYIYISIYSRTVGSCFWKTRPFEPMFYYTTWLPFRFT